MPHVISESTSIHKCQCLSSHTPKRIFLSVTAALNCHFRNLATSNITLSVVLIVNETFEHIFLKNRASWEWGEFSRMKVMGENRKVNKRMNKNIKRISMI